MEKAYLKSIKNNPGLKDWLGAELNRIKQQHKSIRKKNAKRKRETSTSTQTIKTQRTTQTWKKTTACKQELL